MEVKRKTKPILLYPGLNYAQKNSILPAKKKLSENVCLRTKFEIRLKKKFWANFQNYVAIKKCQ